MSKIRSSDTVAEVVIFKELRRRRIFFQKNYRKVFGSPDICFPKKKIAVFIDGDFWHGKNFESRKKKLPKIYWRNKIENNIARDKRVNRRLRKDGWKVYRFWASKAVKHPEKIADKIEILFLEAKNRQVRY